ncbi:MAG TPA: hypothetical protein VGJ84_03770, partial [Polyangiaceae bacterium]
GEGDICFAYDASVLSGQSIRGLEWKQPGESVLLHHATLQATSETRPTGAPFDCNPMPDDAITVHTWAPGRDQLVLPDDVGIELPSTVRTLILQAHIIRLGPEDAGPGTVDICRSASPPVKVAGWLGLRATVPTIPPMADVTSTSRCRFSAAWSLLFDWPHMHRTGATFQAALLHGTERTSLVNLDTWDSDHEFTYPIDLPVEAGDAIEINCGFSNPNATEVVAGPYDDNEMCELGLLGWPGAGNCAYE